MLIDQPLITGSITSDGQFQVPYGPSGSQTSNPTTGSMYYNTTDNELIVFNSGSWISYSVS